ncbi:hypothetical protein MKX73_08990 [Solibacillus sp. FSL W7-1436]|uniref:hypothetical protein n=1 Tax=Solibacillus sp. FSL W7-1436 TaxID=2921705 RepID=UPI0030F73048
MILLEQMKGILEEEGVLLESLGDLLENRLCCRQDDCSFAWIRGQREAGVGFIRTREWFIRRTAADIRKCIEDIRTKSRLI